jgi:hypothetical protein
VLVLVLKQKALVMRRHAVLLRNPNARGVRRFETLLLRRRHKVGMLLRLMHVLLHQLEHLLLLHGQALLCRHERLLVLVLVLHGVENMALACVVRQRNCRRLLSGSLAMG